MPRTYLKCYIVCAWLYTLALRCSIMSGWQVPLATGIKRPPSVLWARDGDGIGMGIIGAWGAGLDSESDTPAGSSLIIIEQFKFVVTRDFEQ